MTRAARSTRAAATLAFVALLATAGAQARAAATDIVAGPGSGMAGRFTTLAVVAQVGDEPRLINADLTLHSVEAINTGADDRSWCGPIDASKPEGPGNPRRYEIGECPLFWADIVASRTSAPVLGLDAVDAGATYAFRCGVFPDMRGLLAIVE